MAKSVFPSRQPFRVVATDQCCGSLHPGFLIRDNVMRFHTPPPNHLTVFQELLSRMKSPMSDEA